MISTQELDGITWVDLESPSNEELEQVAAQYKLDPFVVTELQAPTLKPSVYKGTDYLYLILHFPVGKHSHIGGVAQEVDFILGENYLITVRYEVVDPVHKLRKMLETEAVVDAEPALKHTGELFYRLLMKLYGGVFHELEYQNDNLRTIEERMFAGKEKEMVREISKVSTVLRNFALTIETHEPVLKSLALHGGTLYKNFDIYAEALVGEHMRTETLITSHLSLVSELRETNNSLLTTKQNEIMKVLTIMAFVTFPLSLVAGIFGMNTEHIPIIGHPYDFWIVVGIMFSMTVAFFVYFMTKRWL